MMMIIFGQLLVQMRIYLAFQVSISTDLDTWSKSMMCFGASSRRMLDVCKAAGSFSLSGRCCLFWMEISVAQRRGWFLNRHALRVFTATTYPRRRRKGWAGGVAAWAECVGSHQSFKPLLANLSYQEQKYESLLSKVTFVLLCSSSITGYSIPFNMQACLSYVHSFSLRHGRSILRHLSSMSDFWSSQCDCVQSWVGAKVR